MIVTSFILFAFILTGELNFIKGIIFILILIVYTISTYKRHQSNQGKDIMAEQVNEIEEQFFFLKFN